jgi:triacylglycerol esterase/lipase EstA (alpha/beta hydrolase family)
MGNLSCQLPQLLAPTIAHIVLARSMGGLGSRRMIALNNAIGQRVKTLITIAKPHTSHI